jgi:hypothetical protein
MMVAKSRHHKKIAAAGWRSLLVVRFGKTETVAARMPPVVDVADKALTIQIPTLMVDMMTVDTIIKTQGDKMEKYIYPHKNFYDVTVEINEYITPKDIESQYHHIVENINYERVLVINDGASEKAVRALSRYFEAYGVIAGLRQKGA